MQKQQTFKDTRCDRCFKKHLQCNRAYPTCNQCAKIDDSPCSYKRKFKRRRRDDGTYTSQISVIDLRRIEPKASTPSPLAVVLRAPFRSFVASIMTSLNYPCPRCVPTSLEFLVSNINQHVSVSYKPPKLNRTHTNSHKKLLLLGKAYRAFFENVNPILALFPKGTFELYPRSPLLRAAVLTCGLYWCSGDALVEEAQDQLTAYLMTAAVPSILPPTLDSLQALLVMTIGLFGAPWMGCRIDMLQSISLRIAFAIGLHVPRKNSRVELERRLASNCLLYHINFMSLGGLHISVNLSPLPSNFSFCSSLYFAQSMAHFNRIFPELLDLKLRIVEREGSVAGIDKHISELKSKLDGFNLYFLTKLHRNLGSKLKKTPSLAIMFSFYHAYYSFFISGMRLYRSTNTLSSLQLAPPCPESLSAAIYHCSKALQWGMQSSSHHFHWHILAKFGQCLIFFAFYQNILSKEDSNILCQGVMHLKSLTNNPHSAAIRHYIQFISKLSIFFPKRLIG